METCRRNHTTPTLQYRRFNTAEQIKTGQIMKIRPILAFLALLSLPVPLHAAPADDIQALLAKGDAKAAYALAKKHPDQLGRPGFDFYFGIAAIDSGHAGEGVLALERYVITFPNNLEARLELARGYFVLGENQRAREEFSGVLKANPPPPCCRKC